MQISYDYYRVFYEVAKHRSITRAAGVLLNNQPNVTRAIKNLESELGCTLFVRSNRGVLLTPEGEKLYAHISVACEQIEAGEEELSLDKSLQSGLVSIGASETALHGVLLPALRAYHSAHPGIRIRITNHRTPQAVSAVKNGLVDLAVVTTPTGVNGVLRETPLRTFREIPVCGSDYAELALRPLTLSELLRYPLICLGRETKTFEFYSALFSRSGLTLSPDIEPATADQILPMVKNNLGIGFVPELFLEPAAMGKTVFPLTLIEPIPERSVCLIKRTDHSLSIAAKELERLLLKSAVHKSR